MDLQLQEMLRDYHTTPGDVNLLYQLINRMKRSGMSDLEIAEFFKPSASADWQDDTGLSRVFAYYLECDPFFADKAFYEVDKGLHELVGYYEGMDGPEPIYMASFADWHFRLHEIGEDGNARGTGLFSDQPEPGGFSLDGVIAIQKPDLGEETTLNLYTGDGITWDGVFRLVEDGFNFRASFTATLDNLMIETRKALRSLITSYENDFY